ncbi:MAG TPA: penicillin-binding transpeptidase domain-containing protein [Solirubrobacteraceae bacterium]|jgi:penicillin-binding protein 2|nr:penicillin-binding transpeptidase domain-containing protein [Solirubrobacteraceae bacterium]
MMEPVSERRPPITPQLALRVAIFGAVALGLFAVVFFRLWYLQVLSGDQYLAQANANRVRLLPLPAPRGKIVDRRGKLLVGNNFAAVIEIEPEKLPQEERDLAAAWGQLAGKREARPAGHKGPEIKIPPIPTAQLRARFERLGRVLSQPAETIHRQVVRSLVLVPYSAARVKTDVPASVVGYIRERPELFPGVNVEQTYLRDYPHDELAAQILGTVGQINPEQLHEKRYRGVRRGTVVGTGGIERAYDKYLRGQGGIRRVQVDANGRPIPNSRLKDSKPISGQRVRLSLSLGLQQEAQDAMAGPLNPGSHPGAFVALDPRQGEVLAMGSYPTFDPTIFTKPLTKARYKALLGTNTLAGPLFNRAISGGYPTASTFKPITALAGLDAGLITAEQSIDDPGCIDVGEIERCNAKQQAYGAVNLPKALQVSSDVYFYKLGTSAFYHGGYVIQRWARKLGLDRPTGIDLPGEIGGVIPDRAWRNEINDFERACRKRKHVPAGANVYQAGAAGCGRSDLREYNLGDTVNLAIGQGDVVASPLQMAVLYAALANGGKIVKPHLGLEIESPSAVPIQRIERDPSRRVSIDDGDLAVVRNGLHLATSTPEGTSGDVFAGWDQGRFPIYGKTGTATRDGKQDQSWYVAYVPDPVKPIVIAVTVEEGGFGAAVAAPIACRMLSQWYRQDGKCQAGAAFSR